MPAQSEHLCTPDESTKLLRKCKRQGLAPSIFVDFHVHVDDTSYYPLQTSITVSWPVAEKFLRDTYSRINNLNNKGKLCKVKISIYDSLVFIGG